jgi:hypothetical protein
MSEVCGKYDQVTVVSLTDDASLLLQWMECIPEFVKRDKKPRRTSFRTVGVPAEIRTGNFRIELPLEPTSSLTVIRLTYAVYIVCDVLTAVDVTPCSSLTSEERISATFRAEDVIRRQGARSSQPAGCLAYLQS